MNLSKLARLLGKATTRTRDANAVARGRIPQRLANKAIGRGAGRVLRKLWR
jgi:hypothetical protein